MNKYRMVEILFIFTFLCLVTIPTASCSSPIVYVAGDGSGDYNCDGINDEVEIQQALDYVAANADYTTVYLKSGTYLIDGQMTIGDNTILEGDSDAKIKLVDYANWAKSVPIFTAKNQPCDNITVRGFEIDGNSDNQSDTYLLGQDYYMMFIFRDATNITFNDMYMHHGNDDCIRIVQTAYPGLSDDHNLNFYNNTIYKVGHEGFYLIRVAGANVYNNTITDRTNSAVRFVYGTNSKVYDNTITSDLSGLATGPAIQLQTAASGYLKNIEIYNNDISDINGAGIWMFSQSNKDLNHAADIHIHHNIFRHTGNYWGVDFVGGIVIKGFNNTLIENNVFYECDRGAIVHYARPAYPPQLSGYVTIARNNIIMGTNEGGVTKTGTGAAFLNVEDTTHSFISENNCLYDNVGGNYVGTNIIHTDDVYENPLFVNPDNHDFDLKPNSPLFDSGIGISGNTGSESIPINTAPIMNSIGTKYVYEVNTLTFTLSAIDADGDTLRYSATGLPSGANFDSTSGIFTWAPIVGQAGNYVVTFEVTDGSLTDSEDVTISVSEINSNIYDNRLRESSPDTTLAGNNYIDIGHNDGIGSYRDVMWFDLSEYNTTDTISNATLSLAWYYPENTPRNQDTVVEIYRSADWNPDQVSWNNKADGTPWNNPGGDWFDKNNVAQGSVPYAAIIFKASNVPDNRYYEFDVTELVQDYVNGKYSNTGFFLKARDENNNYIAFYSSDWTNPDQRPKLNIDHTTESGSVIVPEDPSVTPVHLSASSDQITPGETFTVDVLIDPAVPITGAQLDLLFDGSKLTVDGVTEGNLFNQNGASTLFSSGTLLNTNGKIEDVYCSIIGPESVTSQGGMATISMTAGSATGITEIDLANMVISDTNSNLVTSTTSKATVLIDTAPAINPIGAKSVDEVSPLTFVVSATDADGDILTYSAADLPAGASFDSASGVFTWTPAESQAGTYVVTFETTDGYLADSEAITISVNSAYPRWDVNEDGIINILDITLVSQNIDTSAENNPRCDVNQDGLVNILDLTVVGQHFGETVN